MDPAGPASPKPSADRAERAAPALALIGAAAASLLALILTDAGQIVPAQRQVAPWSATWVASAPVAKPTTPDTHLAQDQPPAWQLSQMATALGRSGSAVETVPEVRLETALGTPSGIATAARDGADLSPRFVMTLPETPPYPVEDSAESGVFAASPFVDSPEPADAATLTTAEALAQIAPASAPLRHDTVTPDRGRLLQGTVVPTVASVRAEFDSVDYTLTGVRDANGTVPRLYLQKLPRDLREVASVEIKKAVFIQAVLPVVLRVNEEIAGERERILQLRIRAAQGVALNRKDRFWLVTMCHRYAVEPMDWDALLARVDIVPPSLALAQAAEESGWGTSRFAREGNSLFGQWTNDPDLGMAPLEREEGRSHFVRTYPDLFHTVRSYAYNLNTHRAYRDFREQRREMRANGQIVDGHSLAGALERYSERGDAYVRSLRAIIRHNQLSDFDAARLYDPQITRSEGTEEERSS